MKDQNEFLDRSPVRYADKIETPILFVEGGDDLRTPPAQGGEAMFRTLKALKKPTAMVNFPGRPTSSRARENRSIGSSASSTSSAGWTSGCSESRRTCTT